MEMMHFMEVVLHVMTRVYVAASPYTPYAVPPPFCDSAVRLFAPTVQNVGCPDAEWFVSARLAGQW